MAILKDKYTNLNDEDYSDIRDLTDEELDTLDDLLLEDTICLTANEYQPVVLDGDGEDAAIEHMDPEPFDFLDLEYDPEFPMVTDIMNEDIEKEEYLDCRKARLLLAMNDRHRIDMKIPIEWIDELLFIEERVN